MHDPTTFEQIYGVLTWLWTFISLGIIVGAIAYLVENLRRGWWKRSPDGCTPGFIEIVRQSNYPSGPRALPEIWGMISGLTRGVLTYVALGFVVIWTEFFYILYTGHGFNHMPFLYAAAAAGIIVTVVSQENARRRVLESSWYWGY